MPSIRTEGLTRAELERYLELQQHKAFRAEKDGLIKIIPYPKQRLFYESVMGTEIFTNLWFGANRSGKTMIGARCGSALARYGVPDEEQKVSVGPSGMMVTDRSTIGWVVCVSEKTTITSVQPKYIDNKMQAVDPERPPYIPEWEIDRWDAHKQFLRLKNGSVIWFKNCTQDRETFQGAALDWIHFDEQPKKEIYDECSMRFGAKRFRKFFTCTILPEEGVIGGISWVFDAFIKPIQNKTLKTARLFQASIYENPHNSREVIAEKEAEFAPGDPRRRIRLGGELIAGIGGAKAYGNYNADIHVFDEEDMEPFNQQMPLCVTFDWNVRPLVCLIGQRSGSIFRFYKELIVPEEATVTQMAEKFKEEYPYHGNELWIYGDPNGNRKHVQTSLTNYDIFRNEIADYYPFPKLKLRGNPPSDLVRMGAVNNALKGPGGISNIQISNKCVELIKDFEDVVVDGMGRIKKVPTSSNDPYARRTHLSDALGYFIEYEAPVILHSIAKGSAAGTNFKAPAYGFRKRGKLWTPPK